MDPKFWGGVGIVALGLIALILDRLDIGEFKPESLPPPAAGITAINSDLNFSCTDAIYGLSRDGVRYVRESGGGAVIAARVNNKLGFYELGQYGGLEKMSVSGMDAETRAKLKFVLLNCDQVYLPSGIEFGSS